MPEPSLTSLPQKAHFFGTYISDYRTPTFAAFQNLGYKGGAGSRCKNDEMLDVKDGQRDDDRVALIVKSSFI
jgi:hypothetical protein